MNKKRWLGWGVMSLLALTGLTVFLITSKFAGMVVHIPRYTGKDLVKKGWSEYTNPGQAGLPYVPSSYYTPFDDIHIKGWFIPPLNRKEALKKPAILLVHGRTSNKATTIKYMPWLRKAGYAILAIDLRAHWESGGDTSTMAMYEHREIRGALRVLEKMGYRRSVPMGFSMGATTSLMAAAQKPPGMAGVIAEGGFYRMLDVLVYNGKKQFGNLVMPFIPLVRKKLTRDLGMDPVVVDIGQRWPREGGLPALIIHSEIDDVVPPENADRIVRAIGGNATLYRCKKSAHVSCFKDHPEEYKQKVLGFLSRFN